MPQLQLPIFPSGTTPITNELAFECQEGKVIYVYGHLPVFQHAEGDVTAFRLFTSQLVVNGTASQAEIARAFHVPSKTVKRYVKRLREGGTKSFYQTPRRRTASVLKGERKVHAQALLDEGKSVPEVGRELGVLPNTIHKAIRAGRLRQPQKKT